MFANPLGLYPDPQITTFKGQYILIGTDTLSGARAISLHTAPTLAQLPNATRHVVYTPPATGPECCELWAPELHRIGEGDAARWYIYFAADDGNNNNHRMYALESAGDDPLGPYTNKGKVADSADDRWAIDATVLQLDGKLYFIWSGWKADVNGQQSLFIAPMSNPWTISGPRVLLTEPTLAWEMSGMPINEGPAVLQHDGKTYLTYSASGCWTNDYQLGLLTFNGGDPLNPAAWTKTAQPVFTDVAGVFSPGHNSFFKSPDGKDDWIVYHAQDNQVGGCGGDRTARAQKISWNADGTPNLGQPVAAGEFLAAPSGEVSAELPTCYEAELALVRNARIIDVATASGGKMVAYIETPASLVQFSVLVSVAGAYTMTVHYSNSLDEDAEQKVTVNHQPAVALAYPPSGGRESVKPVTMTVNLQAGGNTIQFAPGAKPARLDFIEIQQVGDLDRMNKILQN